MTAYKLVQATCYKREEERKLRPASTLDALACSSPPQLKPIFQVVFTIVGRGRLYERGLAEHGAGLEIIRIPFCRGCVETRKGRLPALGILGRVAQGLVDTAGATGRGLGVRLRAHFGQCRGGLVVFVHRRGPMFVG